MRTSAAKAEREEGRKRGKAQVSRPDLGGFWSLFDRACDQNTSPPVHRSLLEQPPCTLFDTDRDPGPFVHAVVVGGRHGVDAVGTDHFLHVLERGAKRLAELGATRLRLLER